MAETASAPAPVTKAPPNDTVANKASKRTQPKETPVPVNKPSSRGSYNRDIALVEVKKEKKLSCVKAWEESEKSKAENKAQRHLAAVAAWENSKKAAVEAELKKFEEQLKKKRAEYGERMKNKMAVVHKEAEEKRAVIEAKRSEEVLKTEEMAAKYRATGTIPKKTLGCF